MARSDRIEFYEANQPYYEFTNFYSAPFELDGHVWPTSEHYFQAKKFTDPDLQALVRSQRTPLGAFQLVRYPQYASRVRADWMQVRDDAMYRAVRAKFTQNPRLRDLLLGTGDLPIFEHTNQDRYWGDGGNGTGVNMLGQILMRVREELRVASSRVAPAIATSPPLVSPPPMSLDTLAADPNFQRKLASIRAANFVPEEDVDMTASSSWLPSEESAESVLRIENEQLKQLVRKLQLDFAAQLEQNYNDTAALSSQITARMKRLVAAKYLRHGDASPPSPPLPHGHHVAR